MSQLQISINHDFSTDPFVDLEQLIKETKNLSDQFLKTTFSKFMIDIQNIILNKYLGQKWGSAFMPEVPKWECPRCKQNTLGFKRRGHRTRIIKSSFGKFNYKLFQVTCRQCSKTFSPFPQLLNIPKGQFTEEFRQKLIGLSTELSYYKSSKETKIILNNTASPTSIHRWINQDKLANIKISTTANIKSTVVCMKDSTKVKAGNKNSNKNGLDINVSISVKDRSYVNNRPYNQKQIIAFSVGSSWQDTMKNNNLNKNIFSPKIILTDGENTFDGLINEFSPQSIKLRCSWHAVRTLKWVLKTQCDVEKSRINYFSDCLYSIVKKDDYPTASFKMDLLLDELKTHKKAYTYVLNAQQNILDNVKINRPEHSITDKSDLLTIHTSTSILERLMREINRRTDVGVRWTGKGCENLLKLFLIKKFQPTRWNRIFKQKINFKSVYNLRMSTF
ncbi:MAG: hypothetical protein KAI79_13695 [Bacteroidales bacterium]|nr:hypothetical protein [Bacteroidales bacterium]